MPHEFDFLSAFIDIMIPFIGGGNIRIDNGRNGFWHSVDWIIFHCVIISWRSEIEKSPNLSN